MIIVKGNPDTEAGAMPEEGLLAAMADFHEELARAGVLLDATGLRPRTDGWRIRYGGGRRRIIDGPFTERKELIAGYTLIQVKSEEEARKWSRRFPAPHGADAEGGIEVRRLFELEDFGPGEAIQRFRDVTMPAAE